MQEKQFIPAFNYDFLTPLYDFFLNLLGFGYKERKKIVGLLKLKNNEKLLDIGCGTGSLIIVSKKLHPQNEIVGIDIDDRIIRIARNKIENENLDIELIKAGAEKLPFPNSSFDVVVSSLVFHHLPLEIKKLAIKEVTRVLKNKGRFLLVDFGTADKFWMKTIYPLEKLFGIREAETIKDNLDGKLPILLRELGLQVKEVRQKYKGIEYLLATRL